MSDVTRLLTAIQGGDPSAAGELLPLVYDELRRLAGQRLAREKPGQTIQATALVHDAYLRLVGHDGEGSGWDGRGHFFAAAAEAMRRILVENARRKARIRHGGGHNRVDLSPQLVADGDASGDILALHEALDAFAKIEPMKARLVELRYFAGLGSDEAAEVLGISRATAARHWTYARAWLRREMGGGRPGNPPEP